MNRYRTIVADPPWDHSDGTGKHVDTWGNESLGSADLPEVAA